MARCFVCLSYAALWPINGSATQSEKPAAFAELKTTAATSGVLTIREAFQQVMSSAGLSGGLISWANDCPADKAQEFYIPSGMMLSDALNSIVSTDKAHTWAFQDGGVVLLPLQGIPDLLNTKISAVHITDKNNLPLAMDELLQTVEVKQVAARRGLNLHQGEIGFQKLEKPGSPHHPQSLDLNTLSLLDAVNTIARDRGGVIWEYSQKRCNLHADVRLEFATR